MSTSPAAAPRAVDQISFILTLSLDNTFGAVLIGTFIGLMLYGLTACQTYKYFTMYWKDKLLLKSLITVLFVFDTFHSVLSMHICYHLLVTSFFNPVGLLGPKAWSVELLIPITTVTVLLCQGFYVRRIYLINPRHIFIAVLVILFMIGTAGFAIVGTYEMIKAPTLPDWIPFTWLLSAAISFMVPTDILLSGTLIVYLRRSRTGIRRTDSMLNVLVVYTINTGVLTSTLCLVSLIFAFTQPQSMIYIALSMITTKCYLNSVLAVLNSRRALAESGQGSDDFGTFGMISGMQMSRQQLPPMSFGPPPTSNTLPSHVVDVIYINPGIPTISRSETTGTTGNIEGESSREDIFMVVGEVEKGGETC